MSPSPIAPCRNTTGGPWPCTAPTRLIMDTLASRVETATWATASLDRKVNRPNSSAILPRGLLSVSAASTSAFAEDWALHACQRVEAGFDELTAQDFLGPRPARWHGYWQRA